jgi:diguanylate cyclase (GGDEF)-like protein
MSLDPMNGRVQLRAPRSRSPRRGELRFEEPLESEFRAHYLYRSLTLVRAGGVQGLLLVLVSALLDWRLGSGSFAGQAIAIKLGLLAPALLLLVIAAYSDSLRRYLERVSILAGASMTLGAAALLLYAGSSELQLAVPAALVATVFVYTMLGLRLAPAVTITLPLVVVLIYAETRAGVAGGQLAQVGIYLLFANMIGSFACYALEHSARSAFLEHTVVALLAGNDNVTGIPNRHAFDRHLHTLRRQALRDGKRVALVLARVNRMDAYRTRLGAAAADQALRRIAHAILHALRRPLDLAARLDGDEFGVLLFDPDPNHIQMLVRQIRDAVVMLDIAVEADVPGAGLLSLNLGAALSAERAMPEAGQLLAVAQDALLQAGAPENQGVVVLTAAAAQDGNAVARGPWGQAGQR